MLGGRVCRLAPVEPMGDRAMLFVELRMMTAESPYTSETLQVHVHGRLIVTRFTGVGTVTDFQRVTQIHRQTRERVSGKLYQLTILDVEGGLDLPREVHEAAVRTLATISKDLVAIARVIPVRGFRGAFVQSVVAGISQLAKSHCPQRHFNDLESALSWLVELADERGHRFEFQEVGSGAALNSP